MTLLVNCLTIIPLGGYTLTMHYFKCSVGSFRKVMFSGRIVLVLFWFGLSCGQSFAEDKRLAVMPGDNSPEMESLAELLTTTLSGNSGIALVERAEIKRVLKEQALSAAGLCSASKRVAIGKILGADAYVFVQKTARVSDIRLSLVEAQEGLLVWQTHYSPQDRGYETMAKDFAQFIMKHVDKLAIAQAVRIPVSVVRFYNATAAPDCFWIEDDMPDILAAALLEDPRIILLERRQLGSLQVEKEVASGPLASFRRAGVLIDGEVALREGAKIVGKALPIRMTVRLRDASMQETGRFSVDGSITNMPLVVSQAAAEMRKLLFVTNAPAAAISRETEVLLTLAQERLVTWAAEAAHALDPKDPKVTEKLIELLINAPYKSDTNWDNHIDALLKAVAVCQDTGVGLELFLGSKSPELGYYLRLCKLRAPWDVLDRLEPVRRMVRCAGENVVPRKWIMNSDVSLAFIDEVDLADFQAAGMERKISQGGSMQSKTQTIAESLVVSAMRRPAYISLLMQLPPELRYFCWVKLFRLAKDDMTREYCARAALRVAPAVVRNRSLHKIMASGDASCSTPRPEPANDRFSYPVNEFAALYPDAAQEVRSELWLLFNEMIQSTNLLGLEAHNPRRYMCLLGLPLATQLFEGTCRLTNSLPSNSPSWRRVNGQLETMVAELEKMKPESDRVVVKVVRPEMTVRRLLSCSGLPLDVPRDLWLMRGSMQYDGFTPQRLLLDGDVLWVGMAMETKEQNKTIYMNGLLALDMRSGGVRSFRYGAVPGDDRQRVLCGRNSNRSRTCYSVDLTRLCRWGDSVCVAQSGVGALIYPVSASGNKSLEGVRIIGRKDGLQDLNILWVTGIGDDLFMGTRTAVMVWSRSRNEVQLLASNTGTLGVSPLTGLTFTAVITGATDNAIAVLAAGNNGVVTQRYAKTEGAWHAVAGEIMVVGGKGVGAIGPAPVQPAPYGGGLFGYSALPPMVPPAAFSQKGGSDYEGISFADGGILITGWGEDWALDYYSSNAAPASLSWALPMR